MYDDLNPNSNFQFYYEQWPNRPLQTSDIRNETHLKYKMARTNNWELIYDIQSYTIVRRYELVTLSSFLQVPYKSVTYLILILVFSNNIFEGRPLYSQICLKINFFWQLMAISQFENMVRLNPNFLKDGMKNVIPTKMFVLRVYVLL